jgi:hypothetical protein
MRNSTVTKNQKMDSIDTAKGVVKLTERLRAFANETSLPKSLIVSVTELECSESSAIIPLLWSECIDSDSELVLCVSNGSNPDMPQLITFTLSAKAEHILGTTYSSCTLHVTSEKEPKQIMNTMRVEGHGTG